MVSTYVSDVSLPQNPKCSLGRPRTRWDDAIASFVGASLYDSLNWIDALYDYARQDVMQLTDVFVLSKHTISHQNIVSETIICTL